MTVTMWMLATVVGGLTGHAAVNAAWWLRRLKPSTVEESVVVLLPVRDEAARVAACLRALVAQRGLARLRILVGDDGSTDGTAEIVHSVLGAPAIRVPAPPPGWRGKPHACQHLADAAGPTTDVLVFLDADVVLSGPDALAAAVAAGRGFDLLSAYPRITGAGRLVQPLLQWSWLTFLPLRAMERSARPSLAAAGGQFMVVSRRGYDRAGGHAAVRGEILEDIALARAVKRGGGRIALADASPHAECRMYDTWPDLVAGYTKSLWASTGALAATPLLLLLYAVPPTVAVAALAAGAPGTALAAGCAYLLGVAGRVVSARHTGGRWWPDAFAHPVSVVLYAWLAARSLHRRRRGRLAWKGRPV